MFRFDLSCCGFMLEYFVYFSLIVKVIFEFGNLLVSGDQIAFVCSPQYSISGLDVIYFSCLWLLRFASFSNLLFYLFANIYGMTKEKSHRLIIFEVKFQLIFLFLSSIFFIPLVWLENFIKTDQLWILYMDVYILLAFNFGATKIISTGYLIQLGFNVYFFGIICYHYMEVQPEKKFEKDVGIAIAIVGIDLVMF